jgi:nitroreductase
MEGNLGRCLGFDKAGFMDFQQLVTTRRTVHNYTTEKVQDELVVEALRLSLWAPNHRLTFPWQYVSVGPAARARLADLAVELKSAKAAKAGGAEPMSDAKKHAIRETLVNPSHIILVGVKKSEPHIQHEDYATLACGIQIATLFLWENGISTKWSTGGWAMHAKTYEICGIDSAQVQLEGALLIGKPQITPPAPERPTLDKFFRRTE